MRKEFRVSTKAALYNPDKSKVLVIRINANDDYGLPGGHIDENETPDEAIVREIQEECGIRSGDLQHADFFMHSSGKVILAYTGTADIDVLLSQQNGLEGLPVWLSRKEFEQITIEPAYRNVVMKNWP